MTALININDKLSQSEASDFLPNINLVHAAGYRMTCADCCLKRQCIVAGTDDSDLSEFEKLVNHRRPMAKGKHIFREGDVFTSLFVVRSGSVKTYQTLENGEQQITGFHLPGEVFGLDVLSDNAHKNAAVTLESTALCAIPLKRLFTADGHTTLGEQRFLFLLSDLLNRKDIHSLMLAKNKAHERIAAFLMDLSQRFAHRRLAAHSFALPMSRTDLSNYMGLALESASRAFTRLSKEKVVTSNGCCIEISDARTLATYAGNPFVSAPAQCASAST